MGATMIPVDDPGLYDKIDAEYKFAALAALKGGTEALRRFAHQHGLSVTDTVYFGFQDLSDVSFAGVSFPFRADFQGARLGEADFSSCEFQEAATFASATFAGKVTFDFRKVYAELSFPRTVFKDTVIVRSWGGATTLMFRGARFESVLTSDPVGDYLDWPGTDFSGAEFLWSVNLRKGRWYYASFENAVFREPEEWWDLVDNKPCDFSHSIFLHRADFSGAVFHQAPVFDNSKFLGDTLFDDTTFHSAPWFYEVELHQKTKFPHPNQFPIRFLDKSFGAAQSYRTLKLAMNKQHALAEEAGFFLLEMRSRASGETKFRRAIFHAYDALSVYGQSAGRPFSWLCGITAAFGLIYSLLSGERWETFDSEIFALTLSGAVPFVSALHWREVTPGRESLFPADVTGYVQIALVVQAVVSAVLLFLIGLGLRNIFKIR